MAIAAPIPEISISLAPPELPSADPYSPFAESFSFDDVDDDFRPKHLTPPPTSARFKIRPLSPLRPIENTGKGLERDRFEALLKASRERNSVGSAKKTSDLRKEIALKTHKNKQVERRALFLSKVLAPPSPTAANLPKTPPESPAIFHYTLPSPGLVSPLALFESLNDSSHMGPFTYSRDPWVEQVDFRLPASHKMDEGIRFPVVRESKPAKPLPSLDQISARLSSMGTFTTPSVENTARTTRLPLFLSRQSTTATTERPRLSTCVGRLQMPVRAPKPARAEHLTILPPKSPGQPLTPLLQITTTLVPRSSAMSPTELSESNLLALNSRERRAKDMLFTLRRRMITSDNGYHNGHEEDELEERRSRRHSAPADLGQSHPRSGFEHPVLSLPGAF